MTTHPALEFTRRQFMVTSVTMISAAPLLAQGEKADGDGWIDAHSHIWTPDIEKYPLAKGQTKADLKPPSFTSEELFAVMKTVNVKRVVLIGHTIYYLYDNSYLIDEAARYPDIFRVVAVIDEMAGDPAPRMRELLNQRVTGFRITPFVRGNAWLESEGMHAMWRCGAETRQAMCCLIGAEHLPQVDAMCQQHPETPVVIDHFARIGYDGEVRDKDVATLCRLARYPLVHVKVSAFYALGRKEPPYLDLVPMIRKLFEAFGPKRLMWASDSPYQLEPPHTYQASFDLVAKQLDFITESDRQWLLRDTAQTVFYFV